VQNGCLEKAGPELHRHPDRWYGFQNIFAKKNWQKLATTIVSFFAKI
jgi:hypothetical protein